MPPESSDYAWSDTPVHRTQPRSQEGWTLYAWDARRMQWMRQDEFMNVSLEVALTTMLKWKADGQSAVRMDSVSNLL